jgi:hypothetical protein
MSWRNAACSWIIALAMIGGQREIAVGAAPQRPAQATVQLPPNPFGRQPQSKRPAAARYTVAQDPFADDELPPPANAAPGGASTPPNPFSPHAHEVSTDGQMVDGYYEEGGYPDGCEEGYCEGGYCEEPCCPPEHDPWNICNHCDWTMCAEFWEDARLPQGPLRAAWVQQGVTLNFDSPPNRSNVPVTFNDRANEYQMNQFYAVFGREVCQNGCDWDLGGRLDLLYGTDYFYTTALGLETYDDGAQKWNSENGPRAGGTAALYGVAMPQLYAEINAPVAYGLNVKAGHFYSPLNYESVMAPNNFFYSHSYAFQYGEPKTFTGLLGDLQLSQCWDVQAGFTRGWDVWEDPSDKYSFLGGVGWTSYSRWSNVRFSVTSGPADAVNDENLSAYSLIYTQRINYSTTYALEHVYGRQDDAALEGNRLVAAEWYGLTQYLTHQVNCETQVGARFEWFHDRNNARVLAIPLDGSAGHDYYELTLGANYQPCYCPRWIFKSEMRWDWSNVEFPALDVFGMYDDFTDKNQFTWAFSAITTF